MFAELLGVSLRTLQDWEQGRRGPSAAVLQPLTSDDDLLGEMLEGRP